MSGIVRNIASIGVYAAGNAIGGPIGGAIASTIFGVLFPASTGGFDGTRLNSGVFANGVGGILLHVTESSSSAGCIPTLATSSSAAYNANDYLELYAYAQTAVQVRGNGTNGATYLSVQEIATW